MRADNASSTMRSLSDAIESCAQLVIGLAGGAGVDPPSVTLLSLVTSNENITIERIKNAHGN